VFKKDRRNSHQITMAELMKGHYFTAVTLNRTQGWMAVDCAFNYYVVSNI
jgi:hypothetical protein